MNAPLSAALSSVDPVKLVKVYKKLIAIRNIPAAVNTDSAATTRAQIFIKAHEIAICQTQNII
jgi:hypothetical protein